MAFRLATLMQVRLGYCALSQKDGMATAPCVLACLSGNVVRAQQAQP